MLYRVVFNVLENKQFQVTVNCACTQPLIASVHLFKLISRNFTCFHAFFFTQTMCNDVICGGFGCGFMFLISGWQFPWAGSCRFEAIYHTFWKICNSNAIHIKGLPIFCWSLMQWNYGEGIFRSSMHCDSSVFSTKVEKKRNVFHQFLSPHHVWEN